MNVVEGNILLEHILSLIYPMANKSKWPLLLHGNLQPPFIIRFAGRPQAKKKKNLVKKVL